MKIVEATWEVRNLGRRAFEISLDKRDCQDVDKVLSGLMDPQYNGAYVTVKLPAGNLACLHALEDFGFRFLENQLEVRYALSKYKTPPQIQNLIVPVSIKEIPHVLAEWKVIADKITPDLFETDRISLDPFWGPETGCRRYRNWLLDMCERDDAHLLVFGDPDDPAVEYGFTLDRLDEGNGVLHGILGGVFCDCDKPGIGFSIYDASFRNDVLRGARVLVSAISSNNPAVIAVDAVLGIAEGIRRSTYVLRRQF